MPESQELPKMLRLMTNDKVGIVLGSNLTSMKPLPKGVHQLKRKSTEQTLNRSLPG